MCTPEKRMELLQIDKEELNREEEILREKYAINFDERKRKIKEDSIDNKRTENMYMTEIKQEKWYKKIINKILKFFKIK